MTYKYYCKECGSQFELQMTFKEKDEKRVVCTNCSSDKVNQVFASPVIFFKGSGFYSTDNAGGKHE